jgi:hypothetical protein
MCLVYKNVESLEAPIESEDVTNGVYIRKNITTKERDRNTVYCYEECFLSNKDYATSSIYFARENNKRVQCKINGLDLKRVRAMAEPSIKDETTGQTWLEFYTLQIQELRTQFLEW